MELATNEWNQMKASGSRECFNCHHWDAMAAAKQKPRSVLRTEGGAGSLAELLKQSQPRFAAVPASADGDCFWLYSSGSTGSPKGAVHRHRDMAVCSQRYGVEMLGVREDDVFRSLVDERRAGVRHLVAQGEDVGHAQTP